MTDSLCRKRKLADSFIPCVQVSMKSVTINWLLILWTLEVMGNLKSYAVDNFKLSHLVRDNFMDNLKSYAICLFKCP